MEVTKDYIEAIDERAERRFFTGMLSFDEVEENGAKVLDENTLVGYAAVFNSDSEDFGGWVERIDPGFFDGLIDDEQTVALFNHDMNQVLGRNGVNVKLMIDKNGLQYKIRSLDTTIGQDVQKLVRAKVISKSSFAFTVKEESWTKGDATKGIPAVRTLLKGEALYDVSPVTRPAYPKTTVGARSFEKALKKADAIEQIGMSLTELKLIYNINKRRKFNI